MYSMLTVIGYVGLAIGSGLFNKYFRETEYRKLVIIDAILTILSAPITLVYVLRLSVKWGIPDILLIIMTDSITEIIA